MGESESPKGQGLPSLGPEQLLWSRKGGAHQLRLGSGAGQEALMPGDLGKTGKEAFLSPPALLGPKT